MSSFKSVQGRSKSGTRCLNKTSLGVPIFVGVCIGLDENLEIKSFRADGDRQTIWLGLVNDV